jgi:hypothetical protein
MVFLLSSVLLLGVVVLEVRVKKIYECEILEHFKN